MTTRAECQAILDRLLRHKWFAGWDVRLEMKYLPNEGEDINTAHVVFHAPVKRAVIRVDPSAPKDDIRTMGEIMAHELGHIICDECQNEENLATEIGLLLLEATEDDE